MTAVDECDVRDECARPEIGQGAVPAEVYSRQGDGDQALAELSCKEL